MNDAHPLRIEFNYPTELKEKKYISTEFSRK